MPLIARAQRCLTLMNFDELHQWSFHCHNDVLDEEDDECHFLYWWNGIGAGRSSSDSRSRRCIFVTASPNSDRSFIGFCQMCSERLTRFSDLSLKLLGRWAIGENFMCHLVHLDGLLLSPTSFELRITLS